MQYLEQLVTEKTPILYLQNDRQLSLQEKKEIMGNAYLETYKNYLYYCHSRWYYYKMETLNAGYPFYLIDELMGSYLAKKKAMRTVSYQIAKTKKSFGLASVNFRNSHLDYDYVEQKFAFNMLPRTAIGNICTFQQLAMDSNNQEVLLNHLLELIALDLYMLQKDRCNINLQLETNPNTGWIDFAPFYDFANCIDCVGPSGLYLMNPILELYDVNVRQLLKTYPQFCENILFFLDHKMSDVWNEICRDYHLNQDCFAYAQILEHYKVKEQHQKTYIHELLKIR